MLPGSKSQAKIPSQSYIPFLSEKERQKYTLALKKKETKDILPSMSMVLDPKKANIKSQ